MRYRPTKTHALIFCFIFVGAILFFAITQQVKRDIQLAELERKEQSLSERVVQTVTDTVKAVVPDVLKKTLPPEDNTGLMTYLQVTDSCGPYFDGECLRARSGPGTEFPVIASLRNDMVLKVGETITTGTSTWYKVVFDEWLRYPERQKGALFVSSDYVTIIKDDGPKTLATHPPIGTTTKSILVDRSDQKLYAYDGDTLFMVATTSTGLNSTPTPRGVFIIYKKTPSRYMQGPLPNIASDDYYDLPGVPWNLYFTEGGAVIHGAYWHDKFGTKYSHGCVNLEPSVARKIYDWADLGVKVTVRD